MSSDKKALNVITGPLGVGKTTAILNYLKEHAGEEKIGVLVNDFGTIGLDGTFLEEGNADKSDQLEVQSIPGGCLCCSSGAGFMAGLEKLSKDPSIDRIIIEPSGMVILKELAKLLKSAAETLPIEIKSTVSLIHPGKMTPTHFEKLPFFMQFASEADVLVANGEDRATPEQLATFMEWAGKLTPAKTALLSTSYGVLPPEIFNYDPGHSSSQQSETVEHEHAQRGGMKKPETVVFDLDQLKGFLTPAPENLLRFKGIIHTSEGWKSVQVAQGQLDIQHALKRKESLLEWILSEDADLATFESELLFMTLQSQ